MARCQRVGKVGWLHVKDGNMYVQVSRLGNGVIIVIIVSVHKQ